jgi:hypothetical protein
LSLVRQAQEPIAAALIALPARQTPIHPAASNTNVDPMEPVAQPVE